MGLRLTPILGVTFLLIGVVAAKEAITISPSSATVQPGQSVQLQARTASGTVVAARWGSSAPAIAIVNGSGVVSGVSAGEATITAKDGPYSASIDVTVAVPTTQTPSTPTQIDPSWIPIFPDQNVQTLVNQYPNATTFYLKAGTFHQQRIVPKSGDRFIGEAGAVLDGDQVTPYAFETLTSLPTSVLIQGLEIRNYVPPSGRAAIQGDNGADWIVTGNKIHHNANTGLRTGPRMQVTSNQIYSNGLAGIVAYKSDGILIENNQVFGNNPSGTIGTSDAGMKLMGSRNVTVRGNYVYSNLGKGIWSDTNLPTVLIENNRVTDNRNAGIWHEIGYAAVIRNNTVERNGGTTAPNWLQNGGIAVSNSANVQVYGNTVLDNANGIGVMYASGYPTTGPYGAYIVQNLSVHDNVVRMKIGRTGMSTNTGDTSIYSSQNNHFEHDTYYLGTNITYFLWATQNMTESQWKALGNDDTGTFIR